MGHYAGEMAGGEISDEKALALLEEEREGLASRWEIGLSMAVAYPFNREVYDCPQCYAKVVRTFLAHHDKWHRSLRVQSIIGPGLI